MKYKGKEYRMLLNLDAVCMIEEAGLNLGEVLKGKLSMRTTASLCRIMCNAALDEEFFTDKMIRSEICPGALKELFEEIKAAMEAGMKMQTRQEAEKRDLVLEEIEAEKKPTA